MTHDNLAEYLAAWMMGTDGCMWKALDRLEPDELAHLKKCDDNESRAHEAEIRGFQSLQEVLEND